MSKVLKVIAYSLVLVGSVSPSAYATSMSYRASLGTLPQAQGWTYSGDNGNPSPTVAGGFLHEVTTVGNQYWINFDSTIDFSTGVTLDALLNIVSSNEVPNVGTGTREGYYLDLTDHTGRLYQIGLADGGFNINTFNTPNHPLTPFAIDGLHNYSLQISGNLANFFIDGSLVASNIAPDLTFVGLLSADADFGGSAGASRSVSNLACFSYGTTPSCAAATPVPEPASLTLLGLGLVGVAARRRSKRNV